MDSCFKEFRKKELVSITEGFKIGYVDDFKIDLDTALITHLIVNGKGKFFGLFGKEPDILIPWEDISVIGSDTILVNISVMTNKNNKKLSFKNIFKDLLD